MQRSEIENFIHSNYAGILQDYPWEDTPDCTVFRHADTKKWFALIARVPYATLHLSGSTDFINLKSDPDLIEELLRRPGILPAYHMNKTHWITIPLDRTLPSSEIHPLIDLSYQLTSKKRPPRPIPML